MDVPEWLRVAIPPSALAIWAGYLQMTRPSRKECENMHKGVDGSVDSVKDSFAAVKDNVGIRVDGLAKEIRLLNQNTTLQVEGLRDKISSLQTSVETATSLMIRHVMHDRDSVGGGGA